MDGRANSWASGEPANPNEDAGRFTLGPGGPCGHRGRRLTLWALERDPRLRGPPQATGKGRPASPRRKRVGRHLGGPACASRPGTGNESGGERSEAARSLSNPLTKGQPEPAVPGSAPPPTPAALLPGSGCAVGGSGGAPSTSARVRRRQSALSSRHSRGSHRPRARTAAGTDVVTTPHAPAAPSALAGHPPRPATSWKHGRQTLPANRRRRQEERRLRHGAGAAASPGALGRERGRAGRRRGPPTPLSSTLSRPRGQFSPPGARSPPGDALAGSSPSAPPPRRRAPSPGPSPARTACARARPPPASPRVASRDRAQPRRQRRRQWQREQLRRQRGAGGVWV